MTKLEKELIERLRDLDLRVSVLEHMPTPILFAIGREYPSPVPADLLPPSSLEH